MPTVQCTVLNTLWQNTKRLYIPSPRAATSVATRIGARPERNSDNKKIAIVN